MVLGHDGQLKRLLDGARGSPIPGPGSNAYLDEIVDTKMAGVRAEILDGFESRLSGLENHCNKKIGEVQEQCHLEHMDGQEHMQQTLDGRETGIREELGTLQAQIQGLTLTESCCGQVGSGWGCDLTNMKWNHPICQVNSTDIHLLMGFRCRSLNVEAGELFTCF